MDNTIYTDDSIQSLSPIEHIQTRPGMYIGNLSTPSNLLVEISSNSVDEVNIGHGTHIWIDINDDGSVSVRDEGQGFPIGVKRDDGETVMQASVDVANTSGKFTNDGVYSGNSLGLNGLGMTVVMALSTEFEIYSYNNGKFEYDKYANGKFVEQKLGSYDGRYTPSGTLVKYTPDPKYFGTGKTDKAYFEKFFNELTCLVDNLEIVLNGKSIKHDSIADLLEMKLGKKNETVQHRMVVNNKDYKCAMTFTDSADSDVNVWVNCGITSIGPQITSTKSTLTRVINNWARERGLLKDKDKNLSGSEIQEGMVLVSNITAKDVKYVAQVKSEISELDSNFTNDLQTALELYLDSYPEDGEKIISSAIVARKASEAAKKARQAVKNKTKQKNSLRMPTTLVDCHCKDRSKAELFICEGKSAQGGLVAGRDSSYQAIYGVRGKMLSVLKTKTSNIIKNKEINNLLQALGLDYDDKTAKCKFDKDKLRYGKIIAAADADSDGAAIENLLFNILWYICPELIINGYVYSAVPPLFRVTTKKNEYVYLKDDKALVDYQKQNKNTTQSITRLKGLGEMDDEELSYALLDDTTRNIQKLTISDVKKTNEMFDKLYGKKVEPRVQFLAEHLEEANVD